MNKPNLMESLDPCSGQYSWKTDFRLSFWLLVAALVHVIQSMVLKMQPEWDPAFRVMWTLAPLVPGLLYVRSWVRFIRGLDELQRRIQLEVFLFAALATVIIGAILSALNEQGVSTAWMKHGLGLGSSFMLMLVLWTAGWAFAKRRYQ